VHGVRLTLRATAPTPKEAEARPATVPSPRRCASPSLRWPLAQRQSTVFCELDARAGCARGGVRRTWPRWPPYTDL
jgi:hypothetical protein